MALCILHECLKQYSNSLEKILQDLALEVDQKASSYTLTSALFGLDEADSTCSLLQPFQVQYIETILGIDYPAIIGSKWSALASTDTQLLLQHGYIYNCITKEEVLGYQRHANPNQIVDSIVFLDIIGKVISALKKIHFTAIDVSATITLKMKACKSD